MQKAEASGIGLVGVSNHAPFLLGSYNPVRAAEKGFIAIHWTGTRGEPLVVPAGGADPILPVGPISIAIPSEDGEPIVLDMAWAAASGAPQMAIPYYEQIGKPLPEGWAVTKEGLPTTNPKEALEGAILAIGGAKGAGMLAVLDIMARGLLGEIEGKISIQACWSLSFALTSLFHRRSSPAQFPDCLLKSETPVRGRE